MMKMTRRSKISQLTRKKLKLVMRTKVIKGNSPCRVIYRQKIKVIALIIGSFLYWIKFRGQ